jgi:hypothetical protein
MRDNLCLQTTWIVFVPELRCSMACPGQRFYCYGWKSTGEPLVECATRMTKQIGGCAANRTSLLRLDNEQSRGK